MAYSAYSAGSTGYDLSLFETHGTSAPKLAPAKPAKRPVRKNNVVELPEFDIDKSKRRKHNVFGLVCGFVMAAVIAVTVGVILYGQAQLCELNQQISVAEQELADSKSKYTQMQAKVEGSLSTAAIEKYARKNLGMTKATNQQKEYISLTQGDKAEVYTQKDSDIFTSIGEFLSSLWS